MKRRLLTACLSALFGQVPELALAEAPPQPPAAAHPTEDAEPPAESAASTTEPSNPGPSDTATPAAAKPTNTTTGPETSSRAGAAALPRITDPAFRDRQLSAYSLQQGQLAVTTSLLGASTNDLFAAIGVGYGFGHGIQAGVNVAHLGAALFNLSGKWTFLEKGPFAASVDFDPVFIHGDWVWLVGYQELFSGIDMWLLPASLTSSYLPLPWLQLDFAIRYAGGIILGDISSSRATLDANISAQEFALHPGIRIHILGRSTLNFNADLPLYSAAPASVDAEVQLAPGVAVGGRLGGTRQRSLGETYRVNVGLRSMVTRNLFIDLGFNIGPRVDALYESVIAPRLAVEARF